MIVGVTGAIGQDLAAFLSHRYGAQTVIACCHRTPLPAALAAVVIQEFGVDVRDVASLRRVIEQHRDSLRVVWNLAAPLSVDTAKDPSAAHAITVGGMANLLAALAGALGDDVRRLRVCFSDSIGSFGASAPREMATARWLVAHPEQDPGSDYGVQKREIRGLLKAFPGDTRWAVIPGVLHGKAQWGGGTTEYALEAIDCAVRQQGPFHCKVPLAARLPMIYQSDLIEGLVRLMNAAREDLQEPDGGYALAGLSFTAAELFEEIRQRYPEFTAVETLDGVASRFAMLWPDSLSPIEAQRDLGFVAQINSLDQIVTLIMNAHLAHHS